MKFEPYHVSEIETRNQGSAANMLALVVVNILFESVDCHARHAESL